MSAVGAVLAEKVIAMAMVVYILGVGRRHLPLLKNVAKAAIISAMAGVVTYFVYDTIKVYMLNFGEHYAAEALSTTKLSTLNFVGGSLVLLVSGAVFAPLYLLGANLWGVIEDEEKQSIRNILRRIWPKRVHAPLADPRG